MIGVLASLVLTAWQVGALEAVRAEPGVTDAIWSAPQSLWVSVRDDGSPRDGLAEYVCMVVQDNGLPKDRTLTVRILDVADLDRTIGKARCRGDR